MSTPVDVTDLKPGTKIRTDSGDWTAGDPDDLTRWMHEAGSRTAADALIQRWLDEGRAEVLT